MTRASGLLVVSTLVGYMLSRDFQGYGRRVVWVPTSSSGVLALQWVHLHILGSANATSPLDMVHKAYVLHSLF